MKIFRFDREAGREVSRYGSHGATFTRIATGAVAWALGAMHVDAGGLIGPHPAPSPQLFLVVAGNGWVRGGDGERVPVRAGDAVLWERGEEHEAGSEQGMSAIIFEAETLNPLPPGA